MPLYSDILYRYICIYVFSLALLGPGVMKLYNRLADAFFFPQFYYFVLWSTIRIREPDLFERFIYLIGTVTSPSSVCFVCINVKIHTNYFYAVPNQIVN